MHPLVYLYSNPKRMGKMPLLLQRRNLRLRGVSEELKVTGLVSGRARSRTRSS